MVAGSLSLGSGCQIRSLASLGCSTGLCLTLLEGFLQGSFLGLFVKLLRFTVGLLFLFFNLLGLLLILFLFVSRGLLFVNGLLCLLCLFSFARLSLILWLIFFKAHLFENTLKLFVLKLFLLGLGELLLFWLGFLDLLLGLLFGLRLLGL